MTLKQRRALLWEIRSMTGNIDVIGQCVCRRSVAQNPPVQETVVTRRDVSRGGNEVLCWGGGGPQDPLESFTSSIPMIQVTVDNYDNEIITI